MRKLPAILLSCILLVSSCAHPPRPAEPPLKPFVSDGCSWWPDWDYSDCCYNHDKDYWRGGTPGERKASDVRLMQCVSGKGHTIMPLIMYTGVRIAGHGWLPTPFRWGFGRSWPQGYYAATP
ncbi:MAG: hypothetical protein Q8P24_05035 [Desulfobacterales bacterium]|nr:hypothetical protein [Desulfobacterales bacterium]